MFVNARSPTAHDPAELPLHAPAEQRSLAVHEFPSSQGVPSTTVGCEQAPVAGSHVPGAWHWSGDEQATVEPEHAPAWHTSLFVQALLSLHAVPSAIVGVEHAPLLGSQVPAVWHWSCAAHATGFAPAQTPDWQVSVRVQALPSLQAVPLASAGFEQAPVPGSHVPAAWHWSAAAHVTGLAPVHTPERQVSVRVQALPSVQDVPSASAGFEHAPVVGLHIPAPWHWSWAVQLTGFPPVQAPDWQVSVCVQAFPSLHDDPLALFGFVHAPVL